MVGENEKENLIEDIENFVKNCPYADKEKGLKDLLSDSEIRRIIDQYWFNSFTECGFVLFKPMFVFIKNMPKIFVHAKPSMIIFQKGLLLEGFYNFKLDETDEICLGVVDNSCYLGKFSEVWKEINLLIYDNPTIVNDWKVRPTLRHEIFDEALFDAEQFITKGFTDFSEAEDLKEKQKVYVNVSKNMNVSHVSRRR